MPHADAPRDRPRPALATRAVTAGRPPRTPDAPVGPDVVLTSTYVASPDPTARGYGRTGNPTWEALEEAVGALEGGVAVAFASGMAAISAVLDAVPTGGLVVAPRGAYNTTLALLDELAAGGRLRVERVDVTDVGAVTAAVEGAAMLWLESPTNPLLEVADLGALTAAARAAGATSVVDSTFATPVLQQPLGLGADVVVHSVTKWLSGHSDLLMGAAVVRDDDADRLAALRRRRTLHGAVPGPFEAWLALRGLRTVHLRVERSCASAGELARRLGSHPAVLRVRYPGLPDDPGHALARAQMSGFGGVVSIEVRGGAAGADAVAAACRLWVPATSLGGVESLVERRRRIPTEPEVVPEELLRLSVGVEDVEDLWADLARALDVVAAP